jgi:co-chaperonin GroES (HSP10)|tara:strand:- start:97 stop:372 length:276 start_codon:yes stop_codon:yes gene_type:complete
MSIKKMLGSQVLVTAVEKEQTTSGGIILTGETSKGSKPGLVLAVSEYAAGQIEVGDRVFLDWNKAMPVDINREAAAIIDIEWIKAVLAEES